MTLLRTLASLDRPITRWHAYAVVMSVLAFIAMVLTVFVSWWLYLGCSILTAAAAVAWCMAGIDDEPAS